MVNNFWRIPQDRRFLSFVDFLRKSDLVGKEEIAFIEGNFQSSEKLLDHLKSLKIDGGKLMEAYASSLGVPYIVLNTIDEAATEIISPDAAIKFGFVPFSVDEGAKTIQVAIFKPASFENITEASIKALEEKLGYSIEIFVCSEESAKAALAGKERQVPMIDLSKIEIDISVLGKIPFGVAQKFKAVFFRRSGDGALELAAADPDNAELKDVLGYIRKQAGVKIRVFRSGESQIDQALSFYQKTLEDKNKDQAKPLSQQVQPAVRITEKPTEEPAKDAVGEEARSVPGSESKVPPALGVMPESDIGQLLGNTPVTTESLKHFASSGQVPQLLGGMIYLAVKERASDIHVEPFEKAVRIRFRIDGELSDILLLPIGLISHVVARVKILAKLKLDEQRVPQDGRFEVKALGENIDIRVSTLPTVFGEKTALRLLSKSKKLERLEDLGLEGRNFDKITAAISRPYGIILSTGPTGSGKTTSLYSILSRLNKPEVNIITLEDPVEYEIVGINQTQIKPQIGFGFAEGLRSVLRQDPNIIMVGEIRDRDTAELVTHAALTGHLVLSTLHTNDAASALARLYDLGVEPFLITSSLNVVAGQRLVRRVCPKCRVETSPPQSVVFQAKREFEKINFTHPIKFYKGRGCDQCKDGYRGRVGIFEVLVMSEQIEELILEKKASSEVFTQAIKEGMITMKQDGLIKAVKGITSVDEVLSVTAPVKIEEG